MSGAPPRPVMSGHCATAARTPNPRAAHDRCHLTGCPCDCHTDPEEPDPVTTTVKLYAGPRCLAGDHDACPGRHPIDGRACACPHHQAPATPNVEPDDLEPPGVQLTLDQPPPAKGRERKRKPCLAPSCPSATHNPGHPHLEPAPLDPPPPADVHNHAWSADAEVTYDDDNGGARLLTRTCACGAKLQSDHRGVKTLIPPVTFHGIPVVTDPTMPPGTIRLEPVSADAREAALDAYKAKTREPLEEAAQHAAAPAVVRLTDDERRRLVAAHLALDPAPLWAAVEQILAERGAR